MLPLSSITVGRLLEQTTALHSEKPAVWYQEKTVTYRELLDRVVGYSAVLRTLGVRKGTHVAFLGELDIEGLAVFYALQYMGAIAVMLNTSLGVEEVTGRMQSTDTDILLLGRTFTKSIEEKRKEFSSMSFLKALWTIQDNGSEQPSLSSLLSSVTEEDRRAVKEMAKAVEPEDSAVFLFTSGSTSIPKAVMSSHYSRVNGGLQQAHDLQATSSDRFVVTMPMFHCFCISVNVMASLAVGACLCIPDDRHTSSILSVIEKAGATILSSVPTMFLAMMSKDFFSKEKVKTLRTGFIGGALCPPETFAQIDAAMGPQFTLLSSLGQTECTAGLTVAHLDDTLYVRSTTVGHFMNHVEGKLLSLTDGKEVGIGEIGEICVRGYLVMQGYYRNAEETAKTIDKNGFVHTGDYGYLDGEGNIHLKGRIKELIIRGGENISPSEIENCLTKLAGIKECKVVGVPDPHFGEETCACIVLEEGSKLTIEEIKTHVRARLAYYKVPSYVLILPSLPHTANGKIELKTVKEIARTKCIH